MSLSTWLPALIVLSSLAPGLTIFLLREESHTLRILLNLFGAVTKLLLVGVMIWGVFHEQIYETRWTLAPGLDLVLHADALSVLCVTLSTVLWLVTTVYAIGYLENAPHRSRFFGFFSLCVTATVGLALAGNLFTFVVFYELLTLATYPLVAHKGTPEAVRGARIYLTYTLAGGMLLLVGAVWLRTIAGPLDFAQGGILSDVPGLDPATLSWIFLLLIAGLGVAVTEPALAPAMIAALVFYAAHHGLAKGALFLGVGVVKGTSGRWPLLVLGVLALVLVGAPLTSGALAKDLLKQALLESPSDWAALLVWILPVTATGTALVMARFMYLMNRMTGSAPIAGAASSLPWLGLAAASLGLPLVYRAVSYDLSAAWPILVAVVVAAGVVWRRPSPVTRWVGVVPPGDILEPLARIFRSGHHRWNDRGMRDYLRPAPQK